MAKTELQNKPNTGIANDASEALEQAIIGGDLKSLSPADRVKYYNQVCASIGLNPLTKPFEYIILNNKLTLYARKDCTDQLRSIKNISLEITSKEKIDNLYTVTVKATTANGRNDESTATVVLDNLKGEALANALMKCESKAKRRVTLSIAGLGMLDTAEIATIPTARQSNVDVATGEIIDSQIDYSDAVATLKKNLNSGGTLGLASDKWHALSDTEKKGVWPYLKLHEKEMIKNAFKHGDTIEHKVEGK